MDISILDVIGPVMIGPSSSHTAGAVRLGWTAQALCTGVFDRVVFGLHGSFARTYRGHGTDLALLAGVLGMQPDDEGIRGAFAAAGKRGLAYRFEETELEHVHENAVRIDLLRGEQLLLTMVGSSIGGGRIIVNELNGVRIGLSCELPAMIVRHRDVPGMISHITGILAEEGMNIGTLRLSRNGRGDIAVSILETDEHIPETVTDKVKSLQDVLEALTIQRG